MLVLYFYNVEFLVYFTKDVYSYFEGDPAAEVCLEGSGGIAQPVTVIISSLMRGTATGIYVLYNYVLTW